ncbi:MAG: NADH-ubiquinone oxidoreductase-F iron-sulfur binding region domain-containing protein [Vicinamibacteria bacterium]
MQESGLRGRGGGQFPAAAKWRAVRAEGGEPVVIANGAEGEPGSIKDRHVMLTRSRDVLEGLLLAARAVGAREAFVYLKGSFRAPEAVLQKALAGLDTRGVRVEMRRGADSYVAGEETAVLEVLEGRRAWPRPKPPLPASVGLHGRPTLVQNVETLARVPAAIADPAGFRAHERTLVSIWGDVRRPGVHDVALGTPLGRLIEEHAGGAAGAVGLLFPAGPSAPPLGPEGLELPLDAAALKRAGSGLGTGSLLVVSAARCPLSVGSSLADFFEREACGQCPPCSVGSASLARVLRALEAGGARPKDLAGLAEAAGFMSIHGYCAHSRTAAASVSGLLERCRAELDAHLAGGCPRPGGRWRPFDDDAPARRAIESLVAFEA